ncbi:MAG: alpha-L-arabinofuranosidase C-terminal domain-containing protein [Planctomycetaceae bacterium]|nr:hypothetical protein [Planctomycetaceae bacterium]
MPTKVRIDTDRPAVRFDRMIFGQFLEHFHRQVYGGVFDPGSPLSDRMGLRLDVIEALRELRIPIVRWPGGCFVSAYHWKYGVDPDRTAVFDKAWRVEEPNTFGTDEFVAWCRAIGAEPYICTNAGTGSEEEMSDWVEYCNATVGKFAAQRRANGHEQPHNIKYWSIGNENWGGHEIGAKKAPQWAALVAESGKMMLRVDSSIKLLAAALAEIDWTLPLLREAGHLLSYISIHNYWDGLWMNNAVSDYATCMTRSLGPQEMIRRAASILDVANLGGKVAIAFDEWNLRGWHHPNLGSAAFGDVAARDKNDLNATYTMADAVFSACFLNACLRNAQTVKMACMAPVVNARGPLFVHPKGVVRRTTFHVMKMYSDLLEPNVIDCWSGGETFEHAGQSVPAIDAIATADDAGRTIALALVNRCAEKSIACDVRIAGKALSGTFDATVLSGDSPDAYNDIDAPNRVTPQKTRLAFENGSVALSPHSVTIVSAAC